MTAAKTDAAADVRRVDTRGLKCPWPVLRAARVMRELNTAIILADDPVALTDMPALAFANGWAIDVVEHAAHAEYRLEKIASDPGR